MPLTDPLADSRSESNRIGGLPAIVTGCTLLGALLRFAGLGHRDFWFDESCTFLYVRDLLSWPEDSSLLRESTNLPYYVLLKGWSLLFGHAEVAYRSMSALAGTLTIPLLAWTAWLLRGAVAAAVCAALVAFHPLHIHYSREARAYALWMLILSAATILLLRAARRVRIRDWAAFGAAAWLTLVTHYFTVYWLPATMAAVVWAPDRRQFLRRWAISMFAIVALFAPYAWFAVLPAAGAGGSRWIAEGPATNLLESLWVMLPAADYPAHLRGLSRHSPDTAALGPEALVRLTEFLPAVVALLLTWIVLRERFLQAHSHGDASKRPAVHTPLLVLGVAPLFAAALHSLVGRQNYLAGRYDLVAWPAMTLWLAALIAEAAARVRDRRRGYIAGLVTLVLLSCSAIAVARMLPPRTSPSFARLRAVELARITQPGDLVIALAYDRDYLQYYLWRAGFRADLIAFPSWLQNQIGWVDTDTDLARLQAGGVASDLDQLLRRIERTLSRDRKVWLLADSLDPNGEGPRGPIHNLLPQALRASGAVLTLIDAHRMILSVTKPGAAPKEVDGEPPSPPTER